jgi:peptide/nickel transport system permease protein
MTSQVGGRTANPARAALAIAGAAPAAPAALTTSRRWQWILLCAGLTLLALILVAPWLAPVSPTQGSMAILEPPSAAHFFGTDLFGRDIFSRFMAGGQMLALMAIAAGLVATATGAIIGTTAGYLGGWTDIILMRCVDILLSMPPKLLVLVVAVSLPRNNVLLVLLVGFLMMPNAARIVRGLTQSIAALEFVAAAEVAGARFPTVLAFEILPNVLPRLVLEFALRTGFAVLILAGLNFLGVGISPPSPDWGLTINEGRETFMVAPWIGLFPALGIVLLVVSINLVTNALGELMK